jgi:segregation and condensation protein A
MSDLFQENQSNQSEMPFALIQGEPLTMIPQDLYIPPDALQIFLEAFEGPLDLLLYLIKRQNIDILNIPIADITKQYMQYIDLMENLELELAAEYLVMASMLAEIKSRMLLPRPGGEDDEDDPRAELIRRLQEYEQFKKAAEDLDALPREERDVFMPQPEMPEIKSEIPLPDVSIKDLLAAFRDVVNRAEQFASHHIEREPLSVRERMTIVLGRLKSSGYTEFKDFFDVEEGRMGVVVSFLAILELVKESMIDLVQNEPYAPIYVRARA